MWEFVFKVGNQIYYRTILESIQCKEIKKNGHRCKNHVVIGLPYCYSHSKYFHQLTIKKSLIPNAGNGLYCNNPMKPDNEIIFKKGQLITKYYGEIIDEAEVVERYADKTPPYVVKLSNNRFEDGAKHRGIGALANTSPGNNNATISVSNNGASIKATKNIRNGQEIYLSYGRAYQLNQPNVSSKTVKK